MAKFKFRLAGYLRLRESIRDERRGQLAQAYRAEELLSQEQRRLEEELAALELRLRRASAPGAVDIDELLQSQRYQVLVKAHKEHLLQQDKQVKAEIERRRQALAEANRDVRVLENLRGRQWERHRQEENRQDVKYLDEMAQLRTAREDVP